MVSVTIALLLVKWLHILKHLKNAADHHKNLIALHYGPHTVKILGLRQKKLHKGFYAKNGVPYRCEDDI